MMTSFLFADLIRYFSQSPFWILVNSLSVSAKASTFRSVANTLLSPNAKESTWIDPSSL